MSASEQKKSTCDGHRARLRGRFANAGFSALADYEKVELLLTMCIPRIDVKPIAKELLKKFRNIRGILDADPAELVKTQGIGDGAATMLSFLKQTIVAYLADDLTMPSNTIGTISKLIKYFKAKIASEPSEVLEMVCFDSKLKIIGDSSVRLCEGSINTASVDSRKVVEIAIKKGAASIAIAHNHPSGDPTPSLEDIRFTKRLSEACRPIGVNMIEHVVVGKNACFSFRRDGHFDVLYDDSLEDGRLRGRASVAEERKTISE